MGSSGFEWVCLSGFAVGVAVGGLTVVDSGLWEHHDSALQSVVT